MIKSFLLAVVAAIALVIASPLAASPAATGSASETSAAAYSVRILSVTSPARRRSYATLVARVSPANAMCSIIVFYKSGPSRASGVHPTRAVNGRVSWTWMVGSNTTGGSWPIYVECGSAIAKTRFTVTG